MRLAIVLVIALNLWLDRLIISQQGCRDGHLVSVHLPLLLRRLVEDLACYEVV